MDINEAAKIIAAYATEQGIERLSWSRYTEQWSANVFDGSNINGNFVGYERDNVTDAIDEVAKDFAHLIRKQ